MTAALDRYWLAPAPAKRLAVLRILSGLFAWIYASARIVHFGSYERFSPEQFRPIGVANVLSNPLSPQVSWALAVATAATGLPFVLGYRYRIAGPLFAALLLWVTTYRSSWGMIFHTENLLVLHIAILASSPAADAYAIDAKERADDSASRYGWPIRLLSAVTILTYLIAAIAKLRHNGLDWLTTDFLRNYVAYDALRKAELGSVHSPLGAFLARRGWVFRPLAAFSLLVELAAPAALFSRRIARYWVGAVILFHAGVLVTMAILFPYPLFGIGLASFFDVERIGLRVERWRAARAQG